MTSIIWFRQDLRLSDNEALFEAAKLGDIIPVYIWEDSAPKTYKVGEASRVWLYHSLLSLNQSLKGQLNVYSGRSEDIIRMLIKKYQVKQVFCNQTFEPWYQKQAEKVQRSCQDLGVVFQGYNSNYLWGPNDILKDDGSYYKVFTPFKRKTYQFKPRQIRPAPEKVKYLKDVDNKTTISDLRLLPEVSWHKKIENLWGIGEAFAKKRLNAFIEQGLNGYKLGRDFPAKEHTSRLSPHLHFGEISPAQIWHAVHSQGELHAPEKDIEHFVSEVLWREFSCYLLYHFNNLHCKNFNTKFDTFPWGNEKKLLQAWKKGLTGYPFVDAGMRELWQTGTMHNRVRMVVASFLVKNLNIHWHHGRDWFWNCLLDADLANNSASWQWVAGCGVDAAPYFRIFNPTTQGEKFDKQGEYTKKYVPELKNIPDKYLFKPWEAPEKILKSAGVILGETYPKPIVDLRLSREQALASYKQL